MSNKVVWELLGSLILGTLDRLADVEIVAEVEREKENHPLILYVEGYLRKFFVPNGGLSCPELGNRIREFRKKNPGELKKIIEALVREYYSKISPREFRYMLGERRGLREHLRISTW